MKLRKIFSFVAMGALVGALFTGCGDAGNSGQSDGNKSVKLGMITNLNASEKKLDEILKLLEQKSNVDMLRHTTTYFKNLSTLQMGLESGSIDEISTYDCVANYLTAHNSKFQPVEKHGLNLSDSFCFAVRKGDESLKNDLDKALDTLKNNGTLDKLVEDYIKNVTDKEPPAIAIPYFDGAETLKIAVTGDLPPLDLVLADGTPAGFNTALLAEIAKQLQRNIELIDIDGDARASVLSSGRADVVFWAILPVGDDRPHDIDTPEGAILSNPYFTDKIVHLELKK